MFATAAGQRAPCERQLALLALERLKALVSAVARININNNEPIGNDAEVCIRRLIAKPVLNNAPLGGGRKQAVRGEPAAGMFRGVLAARRPRLSLPQEQKSRPSRSTGQLTGKTA
jgi:hypothetical protein